METQTRGLHCHFSDDLEIETKPTTQIYFTIVEAQFRA
jgi:hypothetical protein